MRTTLLATVALVALAAGCTSSQQPTATPTASAPTSATPTASARPVAGECRALSYASAVAAGDSTATVPCPSRHTAVTFHVADLPQNRATIADVCQRRFAAFVGGTPEDRELSMLHAVWFTPSAADLDAGAAWFRCDVIAVARDGVLAPLSGAMRGALARPAARERYAMCATSRPGTPHFARVICGQKHTWRALSIVTIDAAKYPGVAEVRAQGEEPCRNAAADRAADPLDYQWGYEWPSAEQWRTGQHYGICWIPS